MSATLILLLIAAYFSLLLLVSFVTGKDSSNDAFFIGNKKSPWYVVAFGMIGASLSGVTFISVPGWVAASQFSYMEMVLGYLLGYFLIATVLMPMYYRLNLTSIYTYLEQRFGGKSYKTGAGFFLLSRTIGAAFRLYLVAIVLQTFVMNQLNIPFWLTVLLSIFLIWIYTFRGGIKTIIWTDTLQTLCMLAAVVFTIFAIGQSLELSIGQLVSKVYDSQYSQIFFFENGWSDSKNFVKQFLAGASIAFVMTGLDQDMMQKNLSCRNIKEAQLNMASFSIVLVFVNLLFLSLGALLYIFAAEKGIAIPEKSDLLYATIALEHLSPFIGITFILGLIAAAYSSADSALTALTTSVCVDILNFRESKDKNIVEQQQKTRFFVHIGVSVVLFFTIILFWLINNDAVIAQIFKVAGYTYGPLLGLYVFGFFTKMKPNDDLVPVVCITAPIITYVLNFYSETLFFGYKFGFELLLLNGLLTFLGLLLISQKNEIQHENI